MYKQIDSSDLEYLKSDCLQDEKLASAQAFTILLSYGMADMAKDSSSYTAEQFKTKANLYNEIKLLNVCTNNYAAALGFSYNKAVVELYTNNAINYCKTMLTYF